MFFNNKMPHNSFNSELCSMILSTNIPISKLKHQDVHNFLQNCGIFFLKTLNCIFFEHFPYFFLFNKNILVPTLHFYHIIAHFMSIIFLSNPY